MAGQRKTPSCKKMLQIQVCVLIAILFSVSPAFAGVDTYTWHQKLTVSIQTPAGIRTGSSVTEVTATFYSGWNTMGGGGHYNVTKGDTVAVEIAPRKYVFTLFEDMPIPDAYWILFNTRFPSKEALAVSPSMKDLRRSESLVPGEYDYPMLVVMDDVTDLSSIRRIQVDNKNQSFDGSYKIISMVLEITGEDVTSGKIVNILPCLKSEKRCFPPDNALPYADPMGNLMNSAFWKG